MSAATPLRIINGCHVELLRGPVRFSGAPAAEPTAVPIGIENGEIMKNIHRKTSRREMFVLPSQMNGAEYPSADYKDIVTDIMSYTDDDTGGPRGQLACDFDVAQYICGTASSEINPDGTNYVHGMTNTTPTIRLQNGYLLETPRATATDCRRFIASRDDMEILLSRNIATTGLIATHPLSSTTPRRKTTLASAKRVDLVYASAAPFGNRYGYGNSRTNDWESVCRVVLEQQYYLALAAAVRCIELGDFASYKVYFMPLGGGVFDNPRAWIFDALHRAVVEAQRTFLRPDVARKLTVSMLCWEGNPSELAEFTKLRDKHLASAHTAGKAASSTKPKTAKRSVSNPTKDSASKAAKARKRSAPAPAPAPAPGTTTTSIRQMARATKIRVGRETHPLHQYQVNALTDYMKGKHVEMLHPPLWQLPIGELPYYISNDGRQRHGLVMRPADAPLVSAARQRAIADRGARMDAVARAVKLRVGGRVHPLRKHQADALVAYMRGEPVDSLHPPLRQLRQGQLPQYVDLSGNTFDLVLSASDRALLWSFRESP